MVQRKGEDYRELKVTLPKTALESAKQLSLDLSVAGANDVVAESLHVDLSERPTGKKKRLRITLDIEEEDS